MAGAGHLEKEEKEEERKEKERKGEERKREGEREREEGSYPNFVQFIKVSSSSLALLPAGESEGDALTVLFAVPLRDYGRGGGRTDAIQSEIDDLIEEIERHARLPRADEGPVMTPEAEVHAVEALRVGARKRERLLAVLDTRRPRTLPALGRPQQLFPVAPVDQPRRFVLHAPLRHPVVGAAARAVRRIVVDGFFWDEIAHWETVRVISKRLFRPRPPRAAVVEDGAGLLGGRDPLAVEARDLVVDGARFRLLPMVPHGYDSAARPSVTLIAAAAKSLTPSSSLSVCVLGGSSRIHHQ